MIRVVNTKKENDLSFDEIYQEYYRRVFNYAFGRLLHREEAEDATAEVFLVLLQNLQSYDPKRGSVGTWINRITHNAVENYCRKAYRRKEFPTAELIRTAGQPPGVPHPAAAFRRGTRVFGTSVRAGHDECGNRGTDGSESGICQPALSSSAGKMQEAGQESQKKFINFYKTCQF